MKSFGYRAQAFPSAADFLASPGIDETACMIADINMPQMTGVELRRHLLKLGYAIPTILITAYPNEQIRVRALADGVICYLTKPFDDNVLLNCVRSVLGD
jgi:FixJ family two-component response regulator